MIRRGKCVHEIGKRTREHLEKGIPHRVSGPLLDYTKQGIETISLPVTTAERGVFQYVWDAGIIWRVSLEANAENIVLVVSCNMEIFCASLVVLQMNSCKLELRNVFGTLQSESVQMISRPWIIA